MRTDTYHQALEIVNQNPYGNGAAIFTRDGGAARQFQQSSPTLRRQLHATSSARSNLFALSAGPSDPA